VARDTQQIELEIERARDELAQTLDALSVRANPKNLIEQGKEKVRATFNQPAVKYGLIGAGVLAAAVVVIKIVR